MRKHLLLVFVSIYCFVQNIEAQVGIGTTTPDNSAVLEVSSVTQGMLTPRMTSTQRTAISNPANGLLVYDTDENAFYFYDATQWTKLEGGGGSTLNANDYTGWADYVDGVYTSSNPLVLTANNKITMPNSATIVRDSQKPIDISTFYDASSSTITGRNGDGINIVIEFVAVPLTNSSTNRITLSIDLGGSVGEIYERDFLLSKGQGNEHHYLNSFSAYTLDTWEANGGTVKVRATANTEVYDIRYVITRTHKAR